MLNSTPNGRPVFFAVADGGSDHHAFIAVIRRRRTARIIAVTDGGSDHHVFIAVIPIPMYIGIGTARNSRVFLEHEAFLFRAAPPTRAF